jgi:5'(3')-deoxyribonucleotidase
MLRLGIDVDDVVLDLLTPWLKRIARAVGDGVKEPHWTPDDLTQWEFWKDLGVEESLVWSTLTPDLYNDALPFPGVIEALREIRDMGHQVVFVTSTQSLDEFVAKQRWLIRHGVGTLNDEFKGVGKWSEIKTKGDPSLHLDWLVDDYVGNLEKFTGYGVLVTRPHNRRTIYPGKRIKHLSDLVTMLRYHRVGFAGPEALRKPAGSTLSDVSRETEQAMLDDIMRSYNYQADHCAGPASMEDLAFPRNPVDDLKAISCATGKPLVDCVSCALGVTGGACWTQPPAANVGGRGESCFYPENDERARAWTPPPLPQSIIPQPTSAVRKFATGATRDTDTGKLDYEGFLSPLALRSFAEFMHRNRFQKDGSLRDSDNWQKGIPLDAYMKSLFRHFMEVWMIHRGITALDEKGQEVNLETALNAVLFNAQGYLHEHLKAKSLQDKAA